MKVNQGPTPTSLTPLLNIISSSSIPDTIETDLSTITSIEESYTLPQLVEKLNTALSESDTHIQVKIHDKTNTIMVVVVNDDTEEVIREIPSEKILDLMYNMCVNVGVFLDRKI
ncbi:flagellar protein FlaG [Paenibacillus sp. FJAT-26967]|uniref:flagellar protein FlaG n=1 Tax=Paenibacillus sp. FJAT-26967 TaxID=1729690 RepID=UPI000839151C|nr:flagellar protein FlaG [Paenibacillus sp. FJAT-26967]